MDKDQIITANSSDLNKNLTDDFEDVRLSSPGNGTPQKLSSDSTLLPFERNNIFFRYFCCCKMLL